MGLRGLGRKVCAVAGCCLGAQSLYCGGVLLGGAKFVLWRGVVGGHKVCTVAGGCWVLAKFVLRSAAACACFACTSCRASPYENGHRQIRLQAAGLSMAVFALLIVAHFELFSI